MPLFYFNKYKKKLFINMFILRLKLITIETIIQFKANNIIAK